MAPRVKKTARKNTGGGPPTWRLATTYASRKSAPASGGVKVPTMSLPSSSAPDIIEISSSASSSQSSSPPDWTVHLTDLLDEVPQLGPERMTRLCEDVDNYAKKKVAKKEKEMLQNLDMMVEAKAEEKVAKVKDDLEKHYKKKERETKKKLKEAEKALVWSIGQDWGTRS